LQKQKRDPEKFEIFNYFSTKYKLDDPLAPNAFIDTIRRSLERSKNNDTLIYGKRTELLFAYIVRVLGNVALLKQEDSGDFYYLDEEINAPDYRLILKDGSQLLVEVKNFHQKQPSEKFSVKKDYYNKLARYAKLNNVELKLAIYFSRWNQWVMLSIDAFEEDDNLFTIDLPKALKMSEMSIIGDMIIGTSPDLEIHFLTNKEEANEIDHDGQALFINRDIKIYCAGNEITDSSEKGMAFHLIQFGDWIEKECEAIVRNNKLMGMRFSFTPEERSAENFSIIGSLSSIISKMNRKYTSNKDGKIIAVDIEAPSFVLNAFVNENYKGDHLPLWRFVQQPNSSYRPQNSL
jgi:Holliday junction resolvase